MSVITVTFLSEKLTGNLKLLQKKMQRAGSGYSSLGQKITSNDEIASLDQSFIEMINRIDAARKNLVESEERFDLAVKGSMNGLWDWKVNTQEVWFSTQFKKLLGFEENEFEHTLSAWESRIHPDDRAKTWDMMMGHLSEKKMYDVEYRLKTKSGKYLWFRARGDSLRDSNNKPYRMAGSIQDITHLKEAQQEIFKNEERLHLAMNGAQLGIWDWLDVDQDFQWWSKEFYNLLGFEDQEIEAGFIVFKSLIHPEDRQAFIDVVEKYLKDNTTFKVEFRLKNKNGEYRWYQSSVHDVRQNAANRKRMTALIADIHDQKQAEIELRLNQQRFKNAVHYSSIGFALVSLDGHLMEVNPAFCSLFKMSEKNLIDQNIDDFVFSKDLNIDSELRLQLLNNEIFHYCVEKRLSFESDDVILCQWNVSAVRDLDDHPLYFILQIQDVTDRKKIEDSLKQSKHEIQLEKEELGELTYLISHHLKNSSDQLLGSTNSFSTQFQESVNAVVRDFLKVVRYGLGEMKGLIEDLVLYSQVSHTVIYNEDVDLKQIFEDVCQQMKSLISEHDLKIETSGEWVKIQTYPMFLQKIFKHLILNAIARRLNHTPVLKVSCMTADESCVFVFEDNGRNIETSDLEKIFSISYQPWAVERSETNILLPVCRRMIERLGGSIWAEKNEQDEVRFCFSIPQNQSTSQLIRASAAV